MSIIAIVGKPNTGKSTLFNRIAGRRHAVESDTAGTTRDRIYAERRGKRLDMTFVDTGGIVFGGKLLEEETRRQAEIAIDEADTILFCIDTKEGFSEADREVATLLRRAKGRVFLVGTKADNGQNLEAMVEMYSLGYEDEDIFMVSAVHNFGMQNMLDLIEKDLLKRGFTQAKRSEKEDEVTLAILGRPNAGKSSLTNAFLNEDKLIVSDIPGTTIDSVEFRIKVASQNNDDSEDSSSESDKKTEYKNFRLIDTAGIRRRKKRKSEIEALSAIRSFSALKRADIALLLIDSMEGATHQDQIIMEAILESKTGVIVVVNKWDENDGGRFAQSEDAKEKARDQFLHHLQFKFGFVKWASVVFVSAMEKRNLARIFRLAEDIMIERNKEIRTPIFNQFLEEIFSKYSLKATRTKMIPKIKFGRQVETCPPKFLLFASRHENIHFSSKRFIENRIRETFGFNGTPIEIEFRAKNKEQFFK